MTRLACRFPNAGPIGEQLGFEPIARVAEQAGVDSLHLGDHIVLPEPISSSYPFARDKVFRFPPTTDWYESLATCTWILAATSGVEVGPSVLVLPQRNPLEVAKVTATIDRISGGRLFLGIGAGWLREEFDALNWDFETRFGRMDESVEVMRKLWQSDTNGFDGKHFQLPAGLHSRPLPTRGRIPVLLGGMTPRAVHRAARMYDGWIAVTEPRDPDYRSAEDLLKRVCTHLEKQGRPRTSFRAVIRLITQTGDPVIEGLDQLAGRFADMGFDEVGIDPVWRSLEESGEILSKVRSTLGTAT